MSQGPDAVKRLVSRDTPPAGRQNCFGEAAVTPQPASPIDTRPRRMLRPPMVV